MKNTQDGPDYKKIYTDILDTRFSDKREHCQHLLDKPNLSVKDVIEINNRIFGISTSDSERFTQKRKAYKQSDIFEILDYQKMNKLNNSQLALHFKLSRNTVAKWRKMFLI